MIVSYIIYFKITEMESKVKPELQLSEYFGIKTPENNSQKDLGSIFKLIFELHDAKSITVVILAIISGFSSGALIMIFEYLLSSFIGSLRFTQQPDYVQNNLMAFAYLMIDFCASVLFNSVSFYLTKYHGKILSNHIKKKYLEYVLHEQQSWFDSQNISEIATRVESNSQAIDYAVRLNF